MPRIPNQVLARPVPWRVVFAPTAAEQLLRLRSSHPAVAAQVARLLAQFAKTGIFDDGIGFDAMQHDWLGRYRFKFGPDWRIVVRPVPRANRLVVERIGRRGTPRTPSSIYSDAPGSMAIKSSRR